MGGCGSGPGVGLGRGGEVGGNVGGSTGGLSGISVGSGSRNVGLGMNGLDAALETGGRLLRHFRFGSESV